MMQFSRRSLIGLSTLGVLVSISGGHASAANAATGMLEVYKSPSCGCCGVWVNHVRNGGFMIHITDVEDLDPIKAKFGVTPDLQSCHTALIDGMLLRGMFPSEKSRDCWKNVPPELVWRYLGCLLVRQEWSRVAARIYIR